MTTASVPMPSAGREGDEAPARRLFHRIGGYVWPERRRLGLGFALLLVHSGCRLAQPWLVMLAIDRHLVGEMSEGFWWLAGAFLLISAVELVARWWQQIAIETAGQRALLALRRSVFAHLQRLPAAFYDRTPIGRLVGRVTTDVEALQELFASGVVTVLGDLAFLVAALCLMLSLSVPLTGATLLVVPALVVVTSLVRVHARKAYQIVRAKLSAMNAFLHEQISGMPVVQMFRAQGRRQDEFGEISGDTCAAQLRSVRWETVLSASTELLGSITTALILWYGGGLAFEAMGAPGDVGANTGLTIGALFAFVDYMGKFFGPLNDLSLKYTVMQNALVASDRIFALLDEEPEPPDTNAEVPEKAPDEAEGASITYSGVSFAYTPDQPVLRDVSFDIEPGQKVALVGATGSGKSTILSLLTRLYEITEGSIEVDGIDVGEMPRAQLRRRVGVVPQDVFLFQGSILDNIRMGHPEITEEQAISAADRLHLGDFASRLPRGYHEIIAERGKNLSAGERQLIAFARMLVVAPDILLLDEATSNIDAHTEHLLQQAMHCVMEHRTSLVVAHRLSTIRDADHILVLHKGCLVEQGTHDDLLAARGVYWRLYQLQFAD